MWTNEASKWVKKNKEVYFCVFSGRPVSPYRVCFEKRQLRWSHLLCYKGVPLYISVWQRSVTGVMHVPFVCSVRVPSNLPQGFPLELLAKLCTCLIYLGFSEQAKVSAEQEQWRNWMKGSPVCPVCSHLPFFWCSIVLGSFVGVLCMFDRLADRCPTDWGFHQERC